VTRRLVNIADSITDTDEVEALCQRCEKGDDRSFLTVEVAAFLRRLNQDLTDSRDEIERLRAELRKVGREDGPT